jgi:hypothetical protein
MFPLMQQVLQSWHMVGSVVHAALVSCAEQLAQFMPSTASHMPLVPVLVVVELALLDELLELLLLVVDPDEDIGPAPPEPLFVPLLVPLPVPPPAAGPAPRSMLLSLAHPAIPKIAAVAANAHDFMIKPPRIFALAAAATDLA